ncbi:hypothetical protein AB0H34_21075 [Saccharopolyspora shandongensis]|uniref:hypothetical protein n=1 Tax=Saccharopolyspora shandongensis TaxID=418495 RepID=UPI0033ECD541
MADDEFRYWCEECDYRTPWLTESAGAEEQIEHYDHHHPGTLPGGRVELRAKKTDGAGCLVVLGILFLLLLATFTFRYWP